MRLLPIAMCVLVGVHATPASADPRTRRLANRNYKAGLRHLAKKQHKRAIEKLKIALALGGTRVANYHIGLAYQGKGDLKQARYYLQSFLSEVKRHRKRADAKERIKLIEEQLAAAKKPPDPPPKDPPPKDPPPKDPPPKDPPPKDPPPKDPGIKNPIVQPNGQQDQPRGMTGTRLTGLIAIGIGAALLGTGGYFAKVAGDKSDEISGLFEQGAAWESRYDQLYQEGRDADRNAKLLLGIGAGVAVTGVVLAIIGKRKPIARPVAVSPLRGGGAVVSWSCDF